MCILILIITNLVHIKMSAGDIIMKSISLLALRVLKQLIGNTSLRTSVSDVSTWCALDLS